MRRLDRQIMVAAVALLAVVGTPPAAFGGDRLRIQADAESESILVKNVVPATRLKVTVTARDGTVVAQAVRWSEASEQAIRTGVLEPGMTVVARNAGRVATMPVPDALRRVDRVTDLLRGQAEPGSRVEVVAVHVPRGGEPDQEVRRSLLVGADGRWTWDTSAQLDLIGGDGIFIRVGHPDYALFGGGSVPFMSARIGSSSVFACDLGRAGSDFLLTGADDHPKASAAWWPGPRCHSVVLRDPAGASRIVRVGDVLRGTFADDAVLGTDPFRSHADASADTVVGRCPWAGWWRASLGQVRQTGGATTDGRFAVEPGGLGDLRPGQFVAVTCTKSTGDSLDGGTVTAP